MNTKCDIYLVSSLKGESLLIRQLKIFQSDFVPEVGREYEGFLGFNLPRLKAVAIVTHLKKNGVNSFNVPTQYRDTKRISFEEARNLASSGTQAAVGNVSNQNPMFYVFRPSVDSQIIDEGGGLIAIDSLDGHKWTPDEMAEYMYDFNNVI